MRSHTLLHLVIATMLGCGASPEPAPSAPVAPNEPSTEPAQSAPSDQSPPLNLAGAKGPAFGPGAGAIFGGNRVIVEAHGGLQTLKSWDKTSRENAKSSACDEDFIELEEGAVFLVCTNKPIDGPKTGWTKIEVTAKEATSYAFRYAHWPSVGSETMSGTGLWTPDGENSTLTYTHGADITDTAKAPAPSGPSLTSPEPTSPALTDPEPTGPAPDKGGNPAGTAPE